MGVRTDGNGLGSNTDEIKAALYVFTKQVIEPFQRIITGAVEDILAFNQVPSKVTIEKNDIIEMKEEAAIVQQSEKKKLKLAEEDSFAPTKEMAAEAELGLKWREEYKRGGTEVGVARARDISNMRNLSLDTVTRMNSYFSRHEVDKEADGWNDGEDGFPSAGRIAWQLWGGDPGKEWAARIVERTKQSHQEFTDEQGKIFIEKLKEKAEYINDEWELLSEEDVTDPLAEEDFVLQCQSLGSYANGDESERSKWGDSGLYKLRYAYSQNLSANSRDFCVEMVGLSKAGAVFKYEDIQQMSDDGVNGEFAPAGQSSYSLFRYVGGAFCHHFWKRQIYFRKQEKGKFLPNKGLENDVRVGNVPYVKPKGIEGIAPINRPGRGSLKYS
jgi:hypothetical protein